jgi:hypothetical protein
MKKTIAKWVRLGDLRTAALTEGLSDDEYERAMEAAEARYKRGGRTPLGY